MTEDQIKQLVRQEVNRQMYQAGAPSISPHTHDGNNSPKGLASDTINRIGVMGKINFASNSTYTLYFSSPNPTRLDLNGFAFDTGSSDSSAIIVGMALLSKAYYFQPLSNRSAKQGGTPYPISGVLAQCSSNLYVQDSVDISNTFPHTEEFFIMNAFSSSGAHIVTAQAQNLTPTSIDIVVTNLASGWNVSANFIIT